MDVGMSMYLQNATESDWGKGATSRIISWHFMTLAMVPKNDCTAPKMDLPLKCPNLNFNGKQQSVRVSELPNIIYHENWFKLFLLAHPALK